MQKLASFVLVVTAALLAFTPAAWADPLPERIVVATWNVEWLYDNYTGDNPQELAREQSAPSREAWDWKLAGIAKVIAEIKPTILALQEVENKRVMFYLTSKLKKEYALDYDVAFIEGDDFFTEQDVAVLSLSGLVGFSFQKQTQEMYATKEYYNVNKHVLCHFIWGEGPQKVELLLMNVHFRAAPDAGPIRTRQAKLVRHWLGDAIKAGVNVAVVGDVNSEESYETTTNDGDLGTLRGLNTPAADDDLTDLFEFYKGQSKETHLVHKQFDHILVTPSLVRGRLGGGGLVFKSIAIRKDLVVRGKEQDKDHMDVFWQIPEEERDISDHYPVVAEFALQR
jgi:endonuclease/exonuclease/phosphatase family metal-dependent hydrolase